MALPARLQSTFAPSELFFLAEDHPITIIPRQAMNQIDLIGARKRAEVPLWLAILLKKQGRCNIEAPEWLDEIRLKAVYDKEVKDQSRFSSMPWQWIEISQALLDAASDDLGSGEHVLRNLLRDVRDVRQAKARSGFVELNESHMQMDNLSLMEINEMRKFVVGVMDELRKVEAAVSNQ